MIFPESLPGLMVNGTQLLGKLENLGYQKPAIADLMIMNQNLEKGTNLKKLGRLTKKV